MIQPKKVPKKLGGRDWGGEQWQTRKDGLKNDRWWCAHTLQKDCREHHLSASAMQYVMIRTLTVV